MGSRQNLDVRRVKGTLVATLAKANPPMIWRFDLERNHSFTLALQGEDHEWELGVTSVKGEFHPIARFPQKEDAEDAFEAISVVLSEGQSRLLGAFKVIGLGLLTLFALMLISNVWNQHVAQQQARILDEEDAAPPVTTAPPAPAASAPPSGVPLPADQVLKPPAP